MKGMKIKQFEEVVDFIQKYHKFALCMTDADRIEMKKLYPNMTDYGFCIKYIDSCYDSRFADIWSVSFRGMGNKVTFRTNGFTSVPYENLFDWVMAYLKREWIPNEKQSKEIKQD